MNHPKRRAERRAVRKTWIARRQFIVNRIWRIGDWKVPPGRLAKYNLNCGCKMCHMNKYYKDKRKRRRALDQAIVLNLKSWEE